MDPASADPNWWIDWLVFGPLLLLWALLAPTYVGGRILRLAVGLHNAAAGGDTAVPMPDRGTAMGIVFLATLFNLLVTWSYVTSFSQPPTPHGTGLLRGLDEEQEFDQDGVPQTAAQRAIARAIALLRAFLLGFALLVLSHFLLPTTPWRAFLVTGNTWLIGAAMLAVVLFFYGIEHVLPRRF